MSYPPELYPGSVQLWDPAGSPSSSQEPKFSVPDNKLPEETEKAAEPHNSELDGIRSSEPFWASPSAHQSDPATLSMESESSPSGENNQASPTTFLDSMLPQIAGVKRPFDKTLEASPQSPPQNSTSAAVTSTAPVHAPAPQTPLRYRSTTESLANSRQKLSKPFRSPMLSKKPETRSTSPSTAPSQSTIVSTGPQTPPQTPAPKKTHSPLLSLKSASASKPFRSPLVKPSAASSSSSSAYTAANDRRRIQQLEKKLMTLKQAQKYLADGSTERLNQLAAKWKTAAREAAQELWSLAQSGMPSASENHDGGGKDGGWGYDDKEDDVLAVLKGSSGSSNPFKGSWGWDEGDKTMVEGGGGANLPPDWEPPSPATLSAELATLDGAGHRGSHEEIELPPHNLETKDAQYADRADEEEDEKESNTIGKMLLQLGIPKETLGWDDAQEDFID
ncbi:hypothetical protein DL93DRAFT_2225963 [Clavulina sp. PMI_390]|nr:hypothetical protein DL93DRAFT_2225963 [Clavulina sp. PMI_390]